MCDEEKKNPTTESNVEILETDDVEEYNVESGETQTVEDADDGEADLVDTSADAGGPVDSVLDEGNDMSIEQQEPSESAEPIELSTVDLDSKRDFGAVKIERDHSFFGLWEGAFAPTGHSKSDSLAISIKFYQHAL